MLHADSICLAQRLREISLTLAGGRCVHLIGPNGAGKSSLLSVLAGVLTPDSGQVSYNQIPLDSLSPADLTASRGYQAQGLHTAFSLTVADVMAFFAGQQRCPDVLNQALEIDVFWSRPFNQLSGGEQRRVHLAMTLAPLLSQLNAGNGLLLLDEPMQGLDIRHQHSLLALLQHFAKRGNLIVMSCHDLALSARFADEVLLLDQGQLVKQGKPADTLNASLLSEVFACPLDVFQPVVRQIDQSRP